MQPEGLVLARWSGASVPEEHTLREKMTSEGLRPYRWSNAPGDVYPAHRHAFQKVIYVVSGSIVFGLPERGGEVRLDAGDRLELPKGIQHDAVVGPKGVVCLEAHVD